MPGLDRTGPMGMGPMTGGGWGFCGPYGRFRGWWGFGRGRGFRGGFGRGFGRGFGWWGPQPAWGPWYGPSHAVPYGMTPEEEIDVLKDEATALKNELEAVNRRIEELEKQASETS